MASIFPTRTSVLAVDLTSTGAPTAWQRDRDPETESFIMARLAGLAKLLDHGGTDLIVTGGEFRLGGRRRRDDYLDGALAFSRLGQHTGSVRLAASIPLAGNTPTGVASAVASVHKSTACRGGWQVDAPTPESARGVEAVTSTWKGRADAPAVVVNVRNDVDVEIAAARATVARLRVDTVEDARNLRSAIRSAATDWGRNPDDVAVLVDVHAVLAGESQEAANRAAFIADLGGEQPAGLLQHAGTVSTFATVWQNWVRAGAADGFTILPGSIPTDVLAIATGLLPELDRRGLHVKADAPAAAPERVRTRRQAIAA